MDAVLCPPDPSLQERDAYSHICRACWLTERSQLTSSLGTAAKRADSPKGIPRRGKEASIWWRLSARGEKPGTRVLGRTTLRGRSSLRLWHLPLRPTCPTLPGVDPKGSPPFSFLHGNLCLRVDFPENLRQHVNITCLYTHHFLLLVPQRVASCFVSTGNLKTMMKL